MSLTRDLAFRLPMLTGDDVRRVQQALVRAGVLNAGGADGIFGPGTREAVIAFQRRLNSTNPTIAVDGIVGRDTWSALFSDQAAVNPTGGAVSVPAALGQADGHAWRDLLAPHVERQRAWHGPPVGNGSRRWRLTPDGVEIEGIGVRGSGGPPDTARRVWDRFQAPIQKNAAAYGVPLELIVATICTESRGNPDACREEPGYVSDEATPHRVSPGLMQTLISTAREATQDPSLTRAALLEPETAIRAGTAFLRNQANGKGGTRFDPPLVGIRYNAGSLRPTDSNPWGLIQTARPPEYHADVFTAFFNDTFTVLAALPEAARPGPMVPSFWTWLTLPV